jgi:DNA-binding XRE family transcriptional regulator
MAGFQSLGHTPNSTQCPAEGSGPMSVNKNALKEIREALLMSKTELARKADVSPMTIARIEKGLPCRMETKRKILLALGLDLSEKNRLFSNRN